MIGWILFTITIIAIIACYVKKRFKISWQSLSSALALFLSCFACVITWLRVEIYITNDTFVGVMAGVMGACATIIVGYQIYSSIQHNRRFKEVEGLILALRTELEKAQTGNIISEYKAICAVASSFSDKQLFTSFYTYVLALQKALILENTEFIKSTLHNLNIMRDKIKSIDINKNFSKSHIDKLKSQELISTLEACKLFELIAQDYTNIYNDVDKKIKEIESNGK